MRRLSDTIARLNAAADRPAAGAASGAPRLRSLAGFGANPGALGAWSHVPVGGVDMPLVVVLHGCTQTAEGYDRGAGWSDLADRFGFALVFPEQSRSNNFNTCFNWFVPEDSCRDGGEAASIRQMIAAMVERFPIDPARIFVTGLSAGGAMASTLLATYPEVFAGGAIIAGLPFGAAASMPQAFDRMRGHGHDGDDAAALAVRTASTHPGPWPSVSVWHGDADSTVAPVNADRIVGQWRALQGLPSKPDREETAGRSRHRVWTGDNGKVQLEDYRIAGMGHGTPLRSDGETACGAATAYMLDVGISSSWEIAKGWGLLGAERRVERDATPASAARIDASAARRDAPEPPPAGYPVDIQATIEAALRSAGLMR